MVEIGEPSVILALQPLRLAEWLGEQRIDFLLGNVEAAKVLVFRLQPSQVRDPRTDQQIDTLQFGEQMMQGLGERLHDPSDRWALIRHFKGDQGNADVAC